MAFPARERDPLFDGDTAALLEKRGRELVGLALIGVAVLVGLILGSYSPDDPSWLSATDKPAGNLLGRPGASIAAPLFMIAGYGAWSIVLILATWGARLMSHRGTDRAISCLTFAPIAVALASVYIATHTVPVGWPHSFGLGGLFGETVLGAILSIAPISAAIGIKILSAILFFGAIALTVFVLGFTRPEIVAFGRFLLNGLIFAYAILVALLRSVLRLGGRGIVSAHGAYKAKHKDR
ncbi:MAG: DNA translocase FtsK 4TM domain-containing protein, partial [Pseudomonadota bacterium]